MVRIFFSNKFPWNSDYSRLNYCKWNVRYTVSKMLLLFLWDDPETTSIISVDLENFARININEFGPDINTVPFWPCAKLLVCLLPTFSSLLYKTIPCILFTALFQHPGNTVVSSNLTAVTMTVSKSRYTQTFTSSTSTTLLPLEWRIALVFIPHCNIPEKSWTCHSDNRPLI